VITGSNTVLQSIQYDEPGAGQVIAVRTIRWERELRDREIVVEYRWVPGHFDIEGNNRADHQANKTAVKYRGSLTKTQELLTKFELQTLRG
jgi:ribonuclease HI